MTVRPLSPELAEVARNELNEDPKRLEDGLQHLKDWLTKQPHINANTDDQWLALFLRGCKFSLERAKQKLDLYYTLRSTEPKLFNTLPTLDFFKKVIDLGVVVVLPNPAGPTQPIVSLCRPGCYDPDKYDVVDIVQCSSLMTKILLRENDNIVVAGLTGIMDLENCTVAHILQMNPVLAKKLSVYTQNAVPVRLKGHHYINTMPGFDSVFNLAKTFMNEKNKNRLFVHNNKNDLYKYIPQNILPEEYGGNAGTIRDITDYWKKKVEAYWPWLEEDVQYKSDESKRPGKPKTAEELFGIDGSFRQLQFD